MFGPLFNVRSDAPVAAAALADVTSEHNLARLLITRLDMVRKMRRMQNTGLCRHPAAAGLAGAWWSSRATRRRRRRWAACPSWASTRPPTSCGCGSIAERRAPEVHRPCMYRAGLHTHSCMPVGKHGIRGSLDVSTWHLGRAFAICQQVWVCCRCRSVEVLLYYRRPQTSSLMAATVRKQPRGWTLETLLVMQSGPGPSHRTKCMQEEREEAAQARLQRKRDANDTGMSVSDADMAARLARQVRACL